MRIAYVTAGAAGTICGNCLKDNALAKALMRQGHDAVLLPAYTPLLTDEENVSDERIVLGGVNLYLQSKFSFFRRFGLLDRILDHPRLLRWASSFAVDTDPANLGAMTRDTFLGADGPYRREVAKLVSAVREIRPQVVHLTNSMLASLAGPVAAGLGVPVVCSLQGEADFLAGLPEPYRAECYDLLRSHAQRVDRFVAPCEDQARIMAPILGVAAQRIETVLPGIATEGFESRPVRVEGPFVVGFLARISPTKGLALLAEAVERLREARPDREVQLRVAGWRAGSTQRYVDDLRARHGFEDLGYLSRAGKVEFLESLDAFSVPATYRASKGLYVLEALAAGVPVVQPRIGAFPELLAATEGGLACEPRDSASLAAKLGVLAADRRAAGSLGQAGRAAVLARFASDRMASETMDIYRRVAA